MSNPRFKFGWTVSIIRNKESNQLSYTHFVHTHYILNYSIYGYYVNVDNFQIIY